MTKLTVRLFLLAWLLTLPSQSRAAEAKPNDHNSWYWPEEYRTRLIQEFLDTHMDSMTYQPVHTAESENFIAERLLKSLSDRDIAFGLVVRQQILTSSKGGKDTDRLDHLVLLEETNERIRELILPDEVRLIILLKLNQYYVSFDIPHRQIPILRKAYAISLRVPKLSKRLSYTIPGALGNAYQALGKLDSADRYLGISFANLKESEHTGFYASARSNSYGNLLLEAGKTQRAIEVLRFALSVFDNRDKPNFKTSIMDNMAMAYEAQGELDSALSWHLRNLKVANLASSDRRGIKTMAAIVRIYCGHGLWQKASAFVPQMEAQFDTQSSNKWHHVGRDYHTALHAYYTLKSDLAKIKYHHDHLIKIYSDEVVKWRFNNRRKAVLASDYSLSSAQEKMRHAELKKEQTQAVSTLRGWLILGSAVMFLIVLGFGYYSYRLKLQKEKQLKANLQLERDLAETELENMEFEEQKLQSEMKLKERDLATLAQGIKHRQQAIGEFVQMLKDLNRSDEQNLKKKVNQLRFQLEIELSTNASGDELNSHIDQANTAFFDKLKNMHPDMSKRELEVCGLIRLRMSNKEIAELGQVASKSVIKTKTRIKQRLGLAQGESLDAYLSSI